MKTVPLTQVATAVIGRWDVTRLSRICLGGAMVVLCLTLVAAADDSNQKPKVETKKSDVSKPVEKAVAKPGDKTATEKSAKAPIEQIDEAAAVEFAKLHHPELADLLVTLKRTNKSQYVAALKDLDRDRDRIAKSAERDKERADITLGIWKLDSRIRLEMAKFAMTQEPEREARVRGLLKQRQELKLAALEHEKRRTAARITKIDEQLAVVTENLTDAKIAAELDRMKKAVKGKRSSPATDVKTSKAK